MSKVRCEICGSFFVKVYPHLATHSITAKAYKELFPTAKTSAYTHSAATLDRMRGPRECMKGAVKSEAHRQALSASRKGRKFKPHSPETIQKMKLAWIRRKADKDAFAAYSKSVSDNLIALRGIEDGSLRAKKTGTDLEVRMEAFLNDKRLKYIKQKIIPFDIGYYIYDFIIHELNLIVEVDGEYWHRISCKQYRKDIEKENLAISSGYKFVRISSDNWVPDIIMSDVDTLKAHTAELMRQRALHLGIAD